MYYTEVVIVALLALYLFYVRDAVNSIQEKLDEILKIKGTK